MGAAVLLPNRRPDSGDLRYPVAGSGALGDLRFGPEAGQVGKGDGVGQDSAPLGLDARVGDAYPDKPAAGKRSNTAAHFSPGKSPRGLVHLFLRGSVERQPTNLVFFASCELFS